jgi:hypothetical protein
LARLFAIETEEKNDQTGFFEESEKTKTPMIERKPPSNDGPGLACSFSL